MYNFPIGAMLGSFNLPTDDAPDRTALIGAATGKAPCIAPAEDSVELTKILDGIYESARTVHEAVL